MITYKTWKTINRIVLAVIYIFVLILALSIMGTRLRRSYIDKFCNVDPVPEECEIDYIRYKIKD